MTALGERKPPRRADFDDLTMGFGSDNCRNLAARLELLDEWTKSAGTLSLGEERVTAAMRKRLKDLGG